jgi:hypothetical protein
MKRLILKRVLLLVFLSAPVWGADIQYATRPFKDDITITADRSVTNLYAMGRSVTVKGSVQGDLLAFAREVCVYAPARRDVEVSAGSLFLESPVGASVRIFTGHAFIDAPIGADLAALVGELVISPSSVIQGDMAAAGRKIDLEGSVKGRVFIAGDEVVLDGPVGGEATIRYEKNLTIGPRGRLAGKLECFGPQPPQVEVGASAPNVVYHPAHSLSSMLSRWTAVFGLPALIRLLAWLFSVWLLVKISPRIIINSLASLPDAFGKDIFLGLVVALGALIFLPILFLTIVGIYAALLGGAFFVTLILLARLLAVFLLAWWLRLIFEKEKTTELPFSWVGAAILVIHFSGLVPWLSCVLISLLSIAALGTLTRLIFWWKTNQ